LTRSPYSPSATAITSIYTFPTRRSSDLVRRSFRQVPGIQMRAHHKHLLWILAPANFSYHVRRLHRPACKRILHVKAHAHFFPVLDLKSTRLNSSHVKISYAVFCLKTKNN